MTETEGREARCWATGLVVERVTARMRWLWKGESGACRSLERVFVVLRLVLPGAPAMRIEGAMAGRKELVYFIVVVQRSWSVLCAENRSNCRGRYTSMLANGWLIDADF
jgi:hypothetical protein